MELSYSVKNYAWGKIGESSKVAELYQNSNQEIQIDRSLPFAELWLGTHESGPSTIRETGEPLSSYVQEHPECLGSEVQSTFGDQLPFLFKVLSINTALSIQAHPSKETAKVLHTKWPEIYKDANHKPEMAIALTKFEALCGFRPENELRRFFETVPELVTTIGKHNVIAFMEYKHGFGLKEIFTNLFKASKCLVKCQLKQLLQRFKTLDAQHRSEQLAELVERLHNDYPGDIGCFVVYFVNYLILDPFQAIFLRANLIHAYISGDCVECMAASDNVVRAGLTPKHIDVDTLCNMLEYETATPQELVFNYYLEDNFTKLYLPPVFDFAVAQHQITGRQEYKLKARSTASILLVISGEAKYDNGILIPGTALFLLCDQELSITDISGELLMYQAFVQV